MAENTILGRIQLKYDTLANWNASSLILKLGEVAIAEVPSNTDNSGLTPPAIGIKVGDGTHLFSALPWIQAAAGDVYGWAKAATKPTYQASEITGLSTYITSVSGNGRTYRVVRGNGASDTNVFYLEYKGQNDADWTRDTTYTINLQSFDTRLSELETWANTDYALSTQIGTVVAQRLQNLSLSDTAVENQFVTAVSQANGQIAVTRRALSGADITEGAVSVAHGGTGLTQIPSGEVIVGNGTSTPSTRAIASSVGNNDNLVTGNAVRSYISAQMAGLSGAMHYIGETEDVLTPDFEGAPTIIGKTYTTPQSGDVVISDKTEWIYNGTSWKELGTEGDYAVKGSVGKSDLTAVLRNEIEGKLDATTAASTYVAKNGTDRLMTAAEGTKLGGIEAGAEVNAIESISLNGVAQTIDANRNVELTIDLSNVGRVNGARVLDSTGQDYEDIPLDTTTKKLTFARIAKTGDVADLNQTSGTVLVLNCGSASTVI